MADVRIPVALKLDDESDVYKDLVLPLRTNKELQNFIVNLLVAYHENNTVQAVVDSALDEFNPFNEIHKNLERIHLNHAKRVMLHNQLKNELDGMEEGLSSDFSDEGGSIPVPLLLEGSMSSEEVQDSNILSRLEGLEKAIPVIDGKMDKLLSLLQSNSQIQTTSENIVKEASSQPSPVSTGIVEKAPEHGSNTIELGVQDSGIEISSTEKEQNLAPINVQPISNSVQEVVEDKNTEFVAPVIPAPVQTGNVGITLPPIGGGNAPIFITEEEEPVVEEQPVRKKPASFSKALKSTKKQ